MIFKNRTKRQGFTLIEMVVTTALVGLLMLALSAMMSNGFKSYRFGQQRIDANEEVTKAVSDFEKITRGATGVIVAESTSLTFYSYLKDDNQPGPSKISYYQNDGILYRSTIAPVEVGSTFVYPDSNKIVHIIARYITTTDLFKYYNDTSAELAFPVQLDVVKMIRLTLTADQHPSQSPESATQSTVVQLRNLKNNL